MTDSIRLRITRTQYFAILRALELTEIADIHGGSKFFSARAAADRSAINKITKQTGLGICKEPKGVSVSVWDLRRRDEKE